MKKALVLFFAVVIGISFAFTGFAQEKAATPPAAKVDQQVQADKPVDKPVKTKKAKKAKKPKKAKKAKAAPPEEKPAETK